MGYLLRLLLPVAAFLALVFGVSRRAVPDGPLPRIVHGWQPDAAERSDPSLPEIIRGPVLPAEGPAADLPQIVRGPAGSSRVAKQLSSPGSAPAGGGGMWDVPDGWQIVPPIETPGGGISACIATPGEAADSGLELFIDDEALFGPAVPGSIPSRTDGLINALLDLQRAVHRDVLPPLEDTGDVDP